MEYLTKVSSNLKTSNEEIRLDTYTPQIRKQTLDESMETMKLLTQSKSSVDNLKIILVGICGGQGSGKTKIAQTLQQKIPNSILIEEKNFFKSSTTYRKLSAGDDPLVGDFDGYSKNRKLYLIESNNPNSYDYDKLQENLEKLKKGEKISIPKFDEETLRYEQDIETIINPDEINIAFVEGCFIFEQKKILDLLNFSVYVEIDDDIRLSRLIINENKHLKNNPLAFKTFFMIYEKYMKSSFEKYIESNKNYAKIFLTNYALQEDGNIQTDETLSVLIANLTSKSKAMRKEKLKIKANEEKNNKA